MYCCEACWEGIINLCWSRIFWDIKEDFSVSSIFDTLLLYQLFRIIHFLDLKEPDRSKSQIAERFLRHLAPWVQPCARSLFPHACWILNNHTHTHVSTSDVHFGTTGCRFQLDQMKKPHKWPRQTNKVFTTSLRGDGLDFLHQTNDEILQRKDSGPSKNIFFVALGFFPCRVSTACKGKSKHAAIINSWK